MNRRKNGIYDQIIPKISVIFWNAFTDFKMFAFQNVLCRNWFFYFIPIEMKLDPNSKFGIHESFSKHNIECHLCV